MWIIQKSKVPYTLQLPYFFTYQFLFLFFFRLYWKLPASGPPKSPKKISDTWPELPANIDTAFQDPTSKKIFFFSGNNCYTQHIDPSLVIKQCIILTSYQLFYIRQGCTNTDTEHLGKYLYSPKYSDTYPNTGISGHKEILSARQCCEGAQSRLYIPLQQCGSA